MNRLQNPGKGHDTQLLSKLLDFKIPELLLASRHGWLRQKLVCAKDGRQRGSKLPSSAQASSAFKEKPVTRLEGRKEGW